jgi:subtilisin family serine protease
MDAQPRHLAPPRRLALLVAALAALLVAAPAGAAAPARDYVVVLRDTVSSPSAVAGEHERRLGVRVTSTWGRALEGYAASVPDAAVAELRADPRVEYVEPDRPTQAAAQRLPWGVDRVEADRSVTARSGDGAGAVTAVSVYVLDTGIAPHPDLNLVGQVNLAGGPSGDCSGHGTHVAGTIAARDDFEGVVGVAPGAPVTAVKVLDCNGGGSTSSVIDGVNWVTANARRPAVANLSLGGHPSQAIDDAVRRAAAGGVLFVLASGNEGGDACGLSPARTGTVEGIITAGATDDDDAEASFSNHGACVDLWAPGVRILSTSRSGGTSTFSGTSMAAPHVAGGAALVLARNPGASPAAVEGALRSAAARPGGQSGDGRPILLESVGDF